MVKCDSLLSAQSYLELATGKTYTTNTDNDLEFISNILESLGLDMRYYPFANLNEVVEDNLAVVLVDCLIFNDKTLVFDHEMYWIELPDRSNS